MDPDEKEENNAEIGIKNSKRALKIVELPANLKPKFPMKKKSSDSDEEPVKREEEEKEKEEVVKEEVVTKDGPETDNDEVVNNEVLPEEPKSMFQPVPLKTVTTDEQLNVKKSEYDNQKLETDQEEATTTTHTTDPGPTLGTQTVFIHPKPEKTIEKVAKDMTLKKKESTELQPPITLTPSKVKLVQKKETKTVVHNEHPTVPEKKHRQQKRKGRKIQQSMGSQVVTVTEVSKPTAPPNDGVKSVYAAPTSTPTRAKAKSSKNPKNKDLKNNKIQLTEPKSVEPKSKGKRFKKNKVLKYFHYKFAQSTANPTPEQIAKPFVAAEYGSPVDFKPAPEEFMKNLSVTLKSELAANNHNKDQAFIKNRPWWCDVTTPDKVPVQKSKIQMHRKLKKIAEGNRKAFPPPLPPRIDLGDPLQLSGEDLTKMNGELGERFAPLQITANTFYGTLKFENEKIKFGQENITGVRVDKINPPKITFKVPTVGGRFSEVTSHPPINVNTCMWVYNRKARPGIAVENMPDKRHFRCEARAVAGTKKSVQKTLSAHSLATFSLQSISKKT